MIITIAFPQKTVSILCTHAKYPIKTCSLRIFSWWIGRIWNRTARRFRRVFGKRNRFSLFFSPFQVDEKRVLWSDMHTKLCVERNLGKTLHKFTVTWRKNARDLCLGDRLIVSRIWVDWDNQRTIVCPKCIWADGKNCNCTITCMQWKLLRTRWQQETGFGSFYSPDWQKVPVLICCYLPFSTFAMSRTSERMSKQAGMHVSIHSRNKWIDQFVWQTRNSQYAVRNRFAYNEQLSVRRYK